MSILIQQGDILKIEKISCPVLVTSKDFFNESGEIIGCPIYQNGQEGPLHIYVETDIINGYVQCEKMAMLDMKYRGYTRMGKLNMSDIVNITDAIQGIFDYI